MLATQLEGDLADVVLHASSRVELDGALDERVRRVDGVLGRECDREQLRRRCVGLRMGGR